MAFLFLREEKVMEEKIALLKSQVKEKIAEIVKKQLNHSKLPSSHFSHPKYFFSKSIY